MSDWHLWPKFAREASSCAMTIPRKIRRVWLCPTAGLPHGILNHNAKKIVSLSREACRRTTRHERNSRFHINRTAGCHRDHRDSRLAASAGPCPRPATSQTDLMHEQHEADWHSWCHVCRRLEPIPRLSVHTCRWFGKLLLRLAHPLVQPDGRQPQGVRLPSGRHLG